MLTPCRKGLGKAVARKSQQGIAVEAMRNPLTRKRILYLVGREVQKEIRKMAAESTHSVVGINALKDFVWHTVIDELRNHAPVLLGILQAATKTRVPRANTNAVIDTCAVNILKQRNSKMSLLQKTISLLLYSGHTSIQVSKHKSRLSKSCILYIGV